MQMHRDMRGFANLTNEYFGRADLDVVNVIDDTGNPATLLPLVQQERVKAMFLCVNLVARISPPL